MNEFDKSADEVYEIEPTKQQSKITFKLLVQRHLPEDAQDWDYELCIDHLSKISHVRLDREGICHIDNMELFGTHVTNLYLQHNNITSISNLECLPNLRFIVLSSNKITKVQGLQSLKKLAFLDLADNLIESFDIDEFPQSIVILNMKGNPVSKGNDYRGSIIQDLPNLQQLDLTTVTIDEKRDAGYKVSSEEEEEEDDEEEDNVNDIPELDNNTIASPRPRDLITEMLKRSQDRLEKNLIASKGRKNDIKNVRNERNT